MKDETVKEDLSWQNDESKGIFKLDTEDKLVTLLENGLEELCYFIMTIAYLVSSSSDSALIMIFTIPLVILNY